MTARAAASAQDQSATGAVSSCSALPQFATPAFVVSSPRLLLQIPDAGGGVDEISNCAGDICRITRIGDRICQQLG